MDKRKNNKDTINVIAISTLQNMLSAVLTQKDIFIPVLITGAYASDELRQMIKKYRYKIGYIIDEYPKTYDDFFKMTKSDYPLNFGDIAEFKHTHLKANRFTHRFVLDINESDYRFLITLKFWLGIFNEFKIDYIFSHGFDHGDPSSSIPFDIAKKKNIPIYELGIEYGNIAYEAYSIRKITSSSDIFVKVNKITQNKVNISKYIHDKASSNRTPKTFRHKFKFWKKYHIKLPFKKILSIINCRNETNIFRHYHQKTTKDLMRDYKYIKYIKNQYAKLAVSADFYENYIFYPLHFEPEANIMNRGKISNQLFVIKMLSEHLPNGWKLYVKEHPMQYALDNKLISIILNNVEYFKSEQFYNHIVGLKNTKLIKIDTPSKELIKNAQAVASICGTVTIEAITAKKPLLVFSDTTTITSKVKGVFNINGDADLQNAINKIKKGYNPQYNNFKSVCQKYLIEFKMADLCSNNPTTASKCCEIIKFLNKDYNKQ